MFSKMVKNLRLNLLQQGSRNILLDPSRRTSQSADVQDTLPTQVRLDLGSMVDIDGVQVPKFSKMVKNLGLNLLPEPARQPIQSLEARERSKDQARSSIQLNNIKDPKPVVQGFRVKGDSSNRVIFLNVADLGLTLGEGQLRIGNSELIPIDGLTSFSDTVEHNGGGTVGKDAMKKMLMTHLQHPHAAHVPVELPGPELRVELVATKAVPRGSQEPSVPRNQPRHFFNKFDGKPPAVQEQLPLRSVELSQSSQTVQSRGSSSSFSSFPFLPEEKGKDFPSLISSNQPALSVLQQQHIQLPRQQLQLPRQQQQLPPQPKFEKNLDSLIDFVYDPSSGPTVNKDPRLRNLGDTSSQESSLPQVSFFNKFFFFFSTLWFQAPGVEEVLRQQAELRSLQEQHIQQFSQPPQVTGDLKEKCWIRECWVVVFIFEK